jgi:hypothetical protein
MTIGGRMVIDEPKQSHENQHTRGCIPLALKGRKPSKVLEGIKKMQKGVKSPAVEEKGLKPRTKPLQASAHIISEDDSGANLADVRQTKEFKTIVLTGTKGQKYTVAVPASYVRAIPKVWEWNPERYRVAELIAQGVPMYQIPEDPQVRIKSRMTIYCWLEHPEFKEHVDGLVMETGWANRRERLSKMTRLNEQLLRKVLKDIEGVKFDGKLAGAVLSAITANAKLIAQEKGEFVEESKVTQDTHHSGAVASVGMKIEDIMASKTNDERKELEKEWDELGDEVIRLMTGSKD